jgi:hypothetical protein
MLGFIIFAANAPTVIQQNTDYIGNEKGVPGKKTVVLR